MVFRKQLLEMLDRPRSVSSLARDLGVARGDVEEDLRHLIRSARASGSAIIVEPARCKACGFVFDDEKLTKPGKCPQCRGSRIYEPLIRIASGA